MSPRRKLISKESPPPPLVELGGGRLVPVTSYDAELLSDFASGTVFDLFERKRRSKQQLRLYWKILRAVCTSTGRWPRERNLHNDLKLSLGYCTMAYDLYTRKVIRVPDSVGIEEMNQAEFNAYFERAMGLLAQTIGFDPLDLIAGEER